MHVYSTKLNVIVRVFSLTCVGLLLGTRECGSQDSDICQTGRFDERVPQGYQALVVGAPFTEYGVVSFLNATFAFQPGCVNFLHGIYFQIWRRSTNSSSVWSRVREQYFNVAPLHFLNSFLTVDTLILHSNSAQLEFYPDDVLGYYVISELSFQETGFACSLSVVLVRSWSPSNVDVYGVESESRLERISIVDPPMFPGVFPAIAVHYVTLPNATVTSVTLGECPTNSSVAAFVLTTPTSLQASVVTTPTSLQVSVATTPTSLQVSVATTPTSLQVSVATTPTSLQVSVVTTPRSLQHVAFPSSPITFPLPNVPPGPGTLEDTKLYVIVYSTGGGTCAILVVLIIALVPILCKRRWKRSRRLTNEEIENIVVDREGSAARLPYEPIDGDIYALPNLGITRHNTANEEVSSAYHVYDVIPDILSGEAQQNTNIYEPVNCTSEPDH